MQFTLCGMLYINIILCCAVYRKHLSRVTWG